jgi:MFS family permease
VAGESTSRRRSTVVLLALATAVGATGLAAGGSAGALLAEDMSGSTKWAGMPLGVLVLGSAAGALLISRRTRRRGRGAGLVLGYGIGVAGAVTVVVAAELDQFTLLLVGSAALGAANAAIFLTRYAAAELGGDSRRGRALGVVFFATAIGAVASPNLLGPSGDLAAGLGLAPLSGLYLIAFAAFGVAAALLAALPDGAFAASSESVSRRELRTGLRGARLPLFVLGLTNFVMVAVMALAPVDLMAHGHDLDVVGIVVSVHVLCMFAPSPITGWLADRAGSARVAALGAAFLVVAGGSGAVLDLSSMWAMTVTLALLGLGWNAGVVGGSTMLGAVVPVPLRPQTEAIGEVAMGLAAGAGAPVAGVIVAFGDIGALSIAGALGGVLMLAALGFGARAPRTAFAAASGSS